MLRRIFARSIAPSPELSPEELLRGASRLHLGCGPNALPGWANIDIERKAEGVVVWDLTRPLPLPPGSLRFVYAEHFIEHIDRDEALRLLAECRRLLMPGGVLRLSTPDLAVIVEEYRAGRLDEWADMQWLPQSPCRLLNEGMRLWGHQFVYDRAELHTVLAEAGFATVVDCGWRESGHPELAGLETRPYHRELIVEATP